jgi:hypothetical protein
MVWMEFVATRKIERERRENPNYFTLLYFVVVLTDDDDAITHLPHSAKRFRLSFSHEF